MLINSALRQFVTLQEEMEWFQSREGLHTGTTCTLAVVCQRQFVILHCGDSRAYRLGKKEIQLTTDHSCCGKLTRCLGETGFQRPDVHTGRLGKKEMLLLCTDGFCREAPAAFFRETLGKGQGTLEERICQVGQFLLACGEQDNLTAVALQREGRRAE